MSSKILGVATATCAALCFMSVGRAQDSQQLEQIVVTASPITQDRNAMATLVGSVDRRQILQSGGASLADALANEPGVTGTSFAAGASRPDHPWL